MFYTIFKRSISIFLSLTEVHYHFSGEAEGHCSTDPCRTISACRCGKFPFHDRQRQGGGRQQAHGARRAQAPAAHGLQSGNRRCCRKLMTIWLILQHSTCMWPGDFTSSCLLTINVRVTDLYSSLGTDSSKVTEDTGNFICSSARVPGCDLS